MSANTSPHPARNSGNQLSEWIRSVRSIRVPHCVAAVAWWKNVWYFIGSPPSHNVEIGTSYFALAASACWNARSGYARSGSVYAGRNWPGPRRYTISSTTAVAAASSQACSGRSGRSTRRQTRARASLSTKVITRTTGAHTHDQACSPIDALAR